MSIFGEFDREAVDDEIRGLRQRIADLEAANARLKQPVTDEEFAQHFDTFEVGFEKKAYREEVDALLASRSKEPKGATDNG
jgi:predicted DNA binding CopG/RHH family protein